MTTTTTELDSDHANILSRLVDINARIADLTSEAESLKAELRSLAPGEYALNGRTALRIIPTRRFDTNAAALRLDENVRAQCLVVTYDAAKVKAHLTPLEAEEFMVEAGKPKVVVA